MFSSVIKLNSTFKSLMSKYVLVQELKARECEFYKRKCLESWNIHEKLGRRTRDEQKEAFKERADSISCNKP